MMAMTATGVILSLVCNAKEGYKDPKKFAEKYVREDIEQRYPGAIYNPTLQYRGFELVNVRSEMRESIFSPTSCIICEFRVVPERGVEYYCLDNSFCWAHPGWFGYLLKDALLRERGTGNGRVAPRRDQRPRHDHGVVGRQDQRQVLRRRHKLDAHGGHTGYDPDATNYTATVTAKYSWKAKSGKKTVTKSVTRTFALAVSPDPEFPVRGVVRMEEVRLAEDGSPHHDEGATEIEAWQNLWGSTYKTIGAKVFYTSKKAKYKVYKYTVDVDGKSCALSVKVTPNGKAVATVTYDTGKKSKGKTVYYKPTCSTVVIPHTSPDYYNQYKQFHGEVDLYFAPSAGNNFPGWGGYEFVQ